MSTALISAPAAIKNFTSSRLHASEAICRGVEPSSALKSIYALAEFKSSIIVHQKSQGFYFVLSSLKRNKWLSTEEYLIRCFEAKALSRSVVQFVHNSVCILLCQFPEVHSLWEASLVPRKMTPQRWAMVGDRLVRCHLSPDQISERFCRDGVVSVSALPCQSTLHSRDNQDDTLRMVSEMSSISSYVHSKRISPYYSSIP